MRIKNWSKYQHYKRRTPPWIKLHRSILEDHDWHKLDPVASKMLVMCWLIASEDDGNLPPIEDLAWRLRMDEQALEGVISRLNHWIEHDDSSLISNAKQDSPLESEESKEESESEKQHFDPNFQNHETKFKKNAPALMSQDVALLVMTWLEIKPSDTSCQAHLHHLIGAGATERELLQAMKNHKITMKEENRELKYMPKLSTQMPDVKTVRLIAAMKLKTPSKAKRKGIDQAPIVNQLGETAKQQEARWKKEAEAKK